MTVAFQAAAVAHAERPSRQPARPSRHRSPTQRLRPAVGPQSPPMRLGRHHRTVDLTLESW
eukprot:6413733-Pyramimonas_sp.AAC.1